jgi:hypothetical protein
MTMPFGRHRGIEIRLLPDSYLSWLRTELTLREPLFSAIEAEYARREGALTSNKAPQITLRIDAAELPQLRRIVEAGYRSEARAVHPDTGGDTATMQLLNSLRARVREQLDQLEAQ